MSDAQRSSLVSADTLGDIVLWRRKKLSLSVLVGSTAIWMLLDVYQFNFFAVASWIAMFIVTVLFAYGNLVGLFRKEEPNWSGFEIPEHVAIETARRVHRSIRDGIRWMFHVSAEREWFIFARVVAVLWLLSYVGRFFDFLTPLYIGVVGVLTVPVMHEKNEDKIKRFKEWMKLNARQVYEMVEEKMFKKIKTRVVKEEKKEKKVE